MHGAAFRGVSSLARYVSTRQRAAVNARASPHAREISDPQRRSLLQPLPGRTTQPGSAALQSAIVAITLGGGTGGTMSTHTCQSCGLPSATEPYCSFCIGPDGALQAFEERFERMIQWQARYAPKASRQELERKALAYMAAMPAWQDHARVKAEFP